MKKFGLFIGINKYRQVIPSLDGAEADARALAKLFAERLGFESEVLTDEHLGYGASGSQDVIFEQLEHWKSQFTANGGGVLVVYFAGHGTTTDGQQYLLGPKAPASSLKNPAVGSMGIISEKALHDATDGWPNVKRALIFDACRTPENTRAVEQGTLKSRLGRGIARSEEESLPADLVILRSCPPDQVAYELRNYGDDKKNHSLFTAALLKIISDKVENEIPVTLDAELNQHLTLEMNGLARDYVSHTASSQDKAQAAGQQPEWQGSQLCLIEKTEFRRLKINRLLIAFQAQLSAGQLGNPPGECCRDTLNQLAGLNYEQESARNLSAQLQQAEAAQQRAQQIQREERIIDTARMLGTPEAYAKYLEKCELCEHQAEARQFIADAKDKASWLAAQALGTLAAFEEYVQAMPNGKFVQQAREEIVRLNAEQTVTRVVQDTTSTVPADKADAPAAKSPVPQAALAAEAAWPFPIDTSIETAKVKSDTQTESSDVKVSQTKRKKVVPLIGAAAVLIVIVVVMLPRGKREEIAVAPAQDAAATTDNKVIYTALKPFQDGFKDGTGKGPEMIWMPSGVFNMGSKEGVGDDRERPLRRDVRVGAFGLGKTEVTVGEYLACVKEGGCSEPEWREQGNTYHYQTGSIDLYRKHGAALTGEQSPIVGVSWRNAQEYVNWLSKKTGEAYRLPSEAEWEYACKAGRETTYCGGEDVKQVAWIADNSGFKLQRVGSLAHGANAFGLYDMSGNVWEWVQDCWHAGYQNAPADGGVWSGGDCTKNAVRGGSCYDISRLARAANRDYLETGYRYFYLGFRVARTAR